MKNYIIIQYQHKDYELWNAFISTAKNATFLFHRDFMEYHQDRFQDFSLMVFDGNKLISVLPANKVDDTIISHQGLTYGGFVVTEKIKLEQFLEIFKSVLQFLNAKQILKLDVKLIPSIYNAYFSEEIKYALFLTEAKLTRRDCLSVIDLTKPFSFSKDRKLCARRGEKNNLIIKEELNFELFWNTILIPNLEQKHQVKPVHSLEEIISLQQKFPNNIRHFNVYKEDELVAGTTVFITNTVAHPQYISGNEQKNELGSLDFLYNHLITEVFKDKAFFDFGISNENQGKNLNSGLQFWKETFGTRTIVQDFYEVKTSNFHLLENVML